MKKTQKNILKYTKKKINALKGKPNFYCTFVLWRVFVQ